MAEPPNPQAFTPINTRQVPVIPLTTFLKADHAISGMPPPRMFRVLRNHLLPNKSATLHDYLVDGGSMLQWAWRAASLLENLDKHEPRVAVKYLAILRWIKLRTLWIHHPTGTWEAFMQALQHGAAILEAVAAAYVTPTSGSRFLADMGIRARWGNDWLAEIPRELLFKEAQDYDGNPSVGGQDYDDNPSVGGQEYFDKLSVGVLEAIEKCAKTTTIEETIRRWQAERESATGGRIADGNAPDRRRPMEPNISTAPVPTSADGEDEGDQAETAATEAAASLMSLRNKVQTNPPTIDHRSEQVPRTQESAAPTLPSTTASYISPYPATLRPAPNGFGRPHPVAAPFYAAPQPPRADSAGTLSGPIALSTWVAQAYPMVTPSSAANDPASMPFFPPDHPRGSFTAPAFRGDAQPPPVTTPAFGGNAHPRLLPAPASAAPYVHPALRSNLVYLPSLGLGSSANGCSQPRPFTATSHVNTTFTGIPPQHPSGSIVASIYDGKSRLKAKPASVSVATANPAPSPPTFHHSYPISKPANKPPKVKCKNLQAVNDISEPRQQVLALLRLTEEPCCGECATAVQTMLSAWNGHLGTLAGRL